MSLKSLSNAGTRTGRDREIETETGGALGATEAGARRPLGEPATPRPKARAVTAAHIEANGGKKTGERPLNLTAIQAAAHGLAPHTRPPPAHNPVGSSAQPLKKPGGKERRQLVAKHISKPSTTSGISTAGPTI
jgi:hypothetical protein